VHIPTENAQADGPHRHAADFEQLDEVSRQSSPERVLEQALSALRERGDYHQVFDAQLLCRKAALGLPLTRPTSFEDVPPELRKPVEETYVAAAREVGALFLRRGDIPSAWMYYQVIREPAPVAEAIARVPVTQPPDNRLDEILRIALFERVHPEHGIRLSLEHHGTCSTITALEQVMPALATRERHACAAQMVQWLHEELRESVLRHVRQKVPLIDAATPLDELLVGRDWLFEGGNYHVDVSHLAAVVRFARSLEEPCPELELASQMCDYGSQLEAMLQFPGDPPFEEFYPAHGHYLSIVSGRGRAEGLNYFRRKLAQEPDEADRALPALVLVDLLMRADLLDEAVDVAARHLTRLGSDIGFSFAELCDKAGRYDRLLEVQREQDQLLGYAAALVMQSRGAGPTGSHAVATD
jgi:hypothetical protein